MYVEMQPSRVETGPENNRVLCSRRRVAADELFCEKGQTHPVAKGSVVTLKQQSRVK